jgi:hypothetical protein
MICFLWLRSTPLKSFLRATGSSSDTIIDKSEIIYLCLKDFSVVCLVVSNRSSQKLFGLLAMIHQLKSHS